MQKKYTSIGLMSGTSGDGVDASIIYSNGIDKFEAIKDKYYEYDAEIYKKITPHCARATFAGLFYNETKDPLKLMNVMGHKDFKTTMRYIKMFVETSEDYMPEFEFDGI